MSALLTGTAPQPAPVTSPPPGAGNVRVADFEAVFLRFQGPITQFIYRLIGDREQACDLAQDVFVKAYKALRDGTVIPSQALSAWLFRIAANTSTDILRRRRLITWLPLSLYYDDRGIGSGVAPSGRGTTTTGFHESDETRAGGTATSRLAGERSSYDGGRFENGVADREILKRVFERMPPTYATCLWLCEHEGLSGAEIAATLSISPSAVKMRLMRARERFIALYRQEMGEQEAGAA